VAPPQARPRKVAATCLELGPVIYPVNAVILVKEVVKPVKGVRGVKLDFAFSVIAHPGRGRQAMDGLRKPAEGLT
jgi:hypothetical protein